MQVYIETLRKQHGLSRGELARAVEVDPNTIRRWEVVGFTAGLALRKRVGKALKVKPETLASDVLPREKVGVEHD